MMTAVCLAKVRFDLMLLLLGVVARHPAADHAWLPDKVGSRSPAIFVGGFEDEASAQIKGEDARLLPAGGGTNEVEGCAAATTVA